MPRIDAEQRSKELYANYLGFCERADVKPLDYSSWLARTSQPMIPNYDGPRRGWGDK